MTFKSPKPKHQKIDFVRKLLYKVSKTFLIVREKNKMVEGYHYHAIFKKIKVPPKSWYIKGVHMNLRKIGTSLTMQSNYLTKKDLQDVPAPPQITKENLIDISLKQVRSVVIKNHMKTQNDLDIMRVLNYLSKEIDDPIQYEDYVLICRGKSRLLLERGQRDLTDLGIIESPIPSLEGVNDNESKTTMNHPK